jgi:hypothetical protein
MSSANAAVCEGRNSHMLAVSDVNSSRCQFESMSIRVTVILATFVLLTAAYIIGLQLVSFTAH